MNGVYALKLESGKYYVGASSDVEKRIASHKNKNGSKWTQEYEVKDVLMKIEADSIDRKSLEKALTLDLMQQHGWENVRGYAWCQRELKKKPALLC